MGGVMQFLDFCCTDRYTFATIKDCSNGYMIEQIYTADGLFFSRHGVRNLAYQDDGTSESIIYVKPTEEFVIELNGHLENHYIGFCRFDVPLKKYDWYEITNVIEGYDRDCCKLEFLKLTLKKVQAPMNCEDYA